MRTVSHSLESRVMVVAQSRHRYQAVIAESKQSTQVVWQRLVLGYSLRTGEVIAVPGNKTRGRIMQNAMASFLSDRIASKEAVG